MRKKKKEKKVEQQEKKSRAKYKCPEEVKPLIDKVNLVPFPINMTNLEFEIEHRTRILREKTGDIGAAVSSIEVLQDSLRDLPEDFQDYVKSFCYASHLYPVSISKVSSVEAHRMVREYIVFYKLRGETIYYARRLKSEKEGISHMEVWDVFPITASGVIRKDKDGKNFVEGLAGVIHKIIPDRFRMCEICNRIFWAENKNSFTDSETCRNALRQRRHRQKNKEEIKAKRQKYYQSKKEQKLGKERAKKNGTL
jgi:hypothetical protein